MKIDLKKISYCLITLSLMLIVSGGVSSFLNGLQNDRNETYRRMDEVTDEFEDFSANTSVFEALRDELYSNVLSNIYYDSMYITDTNVKNKLSNYESLVDSLGKGAEKLDKLCENVYYPDSVVNNKCKNYKIIYEQVVNYFVNDINVYNSNVIKYNNYQEGLGTKYYVDEYSTSKKYIDFNNDKIFDGKDD